MQPKFSAAETGSIGREPRNIDADQYQSIATCLTYRFRLRPAPMSTLFDRLYHLHWVTPELARSAQPYLGFYATFLGPHGFRSLINLRGENSGSAWWHAEKRTADRLGIVHFDVKLSSRNLPSRTNLLALLDAFVAAETPVLIKCSGGQDRTSLAAALFLLHRDGRDALPAAEQQFALWPYLHRPKRYQRWLRHFPAYAVGDAGDLPLRLWAQSHYLPENFAAWLESRGLARSFGALQAAE